ncbi:alpha/beta fold hydrolase [Flavobacterium faecale]|uniref:alpha/beta fold hydrolase n=1 Tax=Flavobacterium faecale TaxID=1355330 RepID=UPI003AB05389
MLHYYVYENSLSDQWVTFVHGAGGSSSIWFKQIRDFRKEFNVLLVDLRGHGNSKETSGNSKRYTFSALADDILEVLDFLKITKSHFVGISLGTILIRQLAEAHPHRVQSMVMGGAILKLNLRSQLLIKLGNFFKYVLPYLFLYRFFAFVIMPKRNHRQSRALFVQEAKKMNQSEFLKWFKLTNDVNALLKCFREKEIVIETLYIMGEEDYMFLPPVINVVSSHNQSTRLIVISRSGHVVNVDQPSFFNEAVLAFLNDIK